jgi:hypothetical protein
MKKFLALIGFYFMTLLAGLSQTSPGTLFLGSSFNLNGGDIRSDPANDQQTSGDISTKSDYAVSLQAGKFIGNNLVVGLNLTHSSHQFKVDDYTNGWPHYRHVKSRYYAAGPFIRKYVPVADKFFFFGQGTAQVTLGHQRQETRTDTPNTFITETDSRGAYAGLEAGCTYFITPKLGLDLTSSLVSYNFTKTRQNGLRSHDLHLGVNLASLQYGLRFYFGR